MLYAMADAPNSQLLAKKADGIALRVKVVPGSSRTQVKGRLGDRLKVAVAAAPEGGKANKAVCQLLAKVFNVPVRDVQIIAGHRQVQKTVELTGLTLPDALSRVAEVLDD